MARPKHKLDRDELARLKERVPLSAVIGASIALQRAGHELEGLCPFHVDHDPSLRVVDRKQHYFCNACGAQGDVIDWLTEHRRMSFGEAMRFLREWNGESAQIIAHPATARVAADVEPDWRPICPVPPEAGALIGPDGRTVKIFNPKRAGTAKEWSQLRPKMVFDYHDAAGQLVGHVLRCELASGKKWTPQITFCENGAGERRWCMITLPRGRPLYGLADLLARPEAGVILVEGEKTRDAAARLLPDAAAVTWAGGSQAYRLTDFLPLRGRSVVCVPDADAEGRAAMLGKRRKNGEPLAGICDILTSIGAEVLYVEPPEALPEGWDLADAEASGWDSARARAWIKENLKRGPAIVVEAGAAPLEEVPEELASEGDGEEPPPPAPPGEGPGGYDGRPSVYIIGGKLPAIVDQAERYLMAADLNLYQRGSMIVRPARATINVADKRTITGTRLVSVKLHHMTESFTKAVDFKKYDKRSKDWFSVDCPLDVAATYLERDGIWRLPILAGTINAPTLRPDGSILDTPGYDELTGLFYDPEGADYPPIPQQPSEEDAILALDVLQDLVSTFPFADDESRSVALSGILTAVVRRSLRTAPCHAYSAPAAGSGKSLLVDVTSMIAMGHEAPVIAQGKTDEEMEKRLGAALIAGDQIISIDNCEQGFGGELLCQMLTQTMLRIRILGRSTNALIPSNCSLFATGNNLAILGDMTRRTLVCTIDPNCERPEQREFDTEPVEIVRHDRSRYLAAALTVLRAFHVAGRPRQSLPLGSFGEWSSWVRDALIWLGRVDPCKTMEKVREEDPKLEALSVIMHEWAKVIGFQRTTVKDVIAKATSMRAGLFQDSPPELCYPDFREALLVVAGGGGVVNSKRLGKWLASIKGRIANRMKFVPDGSHAGVLYWLLSEVK